MATCTHCGAELVEGQQFCAGCGQAVTTAQETAPSSTGALEPAPQAAVQVGDRVAEVARAVRGAQPAQKPTYDIGDKKTEIGQVIIQGEARPQVEHCASCGRPLALQETYKCPKCGAIICVGHYKIDLKVCACCTPTAFEAMVSCGICRQRVPQSETFECPKCHIVADRGHLDSKVNMCQPCAAQYEKLVDRLKQGETVVTQSGVIATEDDYDHLVASRKGLRTPDGQQVATIKPQVWYARQWYQVKSSRLREEVEAMQRFYPLMKLDTAPDGAKLWEGPLTTWRGETYQVRVVYPSYFPYQPPKAYIISPKIPASRHIYADGHLCMFHPDDHTWLPTTTAATVLSWVSRWLHSYEVWKDTGEWPGEEHDQEVIATKY